MLHRLAWLITVLTGLVFLTIPTMLQGESTLVISILLYAFFGVIGVTAVLVGLIALKIDTGKLENKSYNEVIFVFGSGGHTGELC